jgi:hypothetical protein
VLCKTRTEGKIEGRIEVTVGGGRTKRKKLEEEEDASSYSITLRKREEIEN